MGNGVSEHQDLPEPYKDSIMCISFRAPSFVRVINGDRVLEIVRKAIEDTWGYDRIYEVSDQHGANTFVLRGTPFDCINKHETMLMRTMCCRLLTDMNNAGWCMEMSSNLTIQDDFSDWFFTVPPKDLEASMNTKRITYLQTICISIAGANDLQLINAGEEEEILTEMVDHLITSHYETEVLDEVDDYGHQTETTETGIIFHLNSDPWIAEGSNRKHGLTLLLKLFAALEISDYKYVARLSHKSTMESLFFAVEDKSGDDYPKNDESSEYSNSDDSSSEGDLSSARHYGKQPFGFDMKNMATSDSKIFMICLERTNKIRVINAQRSTVDVIRGVIEDHWTLGIQRERIDPKDGKTWEIKVHGSPWEVYTGGNETGTKYIINYLLDTFLRMGSQLFMTFDPSRNDGDKAIFIFRTSPNAEIVDILCIKPTLSDVLKVIGGNYDIEEMLRYVIAHAWPPGIEEEIAFQASNTVVFKLEGHPWGGSESDLLFAKSLIAEIVGHLGIRGWHVVASCCIDSLNVEMDGVNRICRTDTIYLKRDFHEMTESVEPFRFTPSSSEYEISETDTETESNSHHGYS